MMINMENKRIKQYERISRCIYKKSNVSLKVGIMIFRDKHNGTLLNIRRDDFANDRKYFQEIIRIARDTATGDTPRFSCPFGDFMDHIGFGNSDKHT